MLHVEARFGWHPCFSLHLRPAAVILACSLSCSDEKYFIWGYCGTQYRVRFYPPFGVILILYKEYYLTRFSEQKKATQMAFACHFALQLHMSPALEAYLLGPWPLAATQS